MKRFRTVAIVLFVGFATVLATPAPAAADVPQWCLDWYYNSDSLFKRSIAVLCMEATVDKTQMTRNTAIR